MTPDIDALVKQLQAREAALGDGGDVLNTPHAQATFYALKRTLAAVISGLRNVPADLARPTELLVDAEAQRQEVLDKDTELVQAIETAPDWSTFTDARERDKEYDRQRDLRLQLQHLHRGTLYKSPGVTYPRLDYIEHTIADLTQRRDHAQSALDALVRDAEAVLGEPVAR